ncbi:MAG: bifunctional UDP-N-acetylglucosamine diphosphorylase/glucosamine-1-phosphate N-acetyltransferase GlmU [Anaerolineae bacterium]
MSLSIVVLAAGQGIRMKSQLPRVLHPLAGRPMVKYVLDVTTQLEPTSLALVVGYGAQQLRQVLGEEILYVEQLGTGHAVLQARELLAGRAKTVLVLHGDMPFITRQTLEAMLSHHTENRATITLLAFRPDDPTGYGRVLRDETGRVVGIIEHKEATPAQREITEVNSGILCFRDAWLWSHLERLQPKHGEYHLTDLVELAVAEGEPVAAKAADVTEVMRLDDRVKLARAEALMRQRINEGWMLAGVSLLDPTSTYIEASVEVGQDTVIYPNTHLRGATAIGRDCCIGPNTIICDSTVGSGCVIQASVVEGATVEDDVDVGPFAHLRKGTHLAKGVHVGNFGEIKNSYVGPGTKMGHFSYVGDATLGANVNVGAGTITCNYDGERKHPTVVEDDVFIGSDTMLVAPVKVGKGAKTGAGAVVTRDVPPGQVVYGVPARSKQEREKNKNE